MFEPHVYLHRRERLRSVIESGLVLLLGNDESPINSPGITYPFRQDSSFLYFLGLNISGLVALMDMEEGTETIYGDDPGVDEIVWTGSVPALAEACKRTGIADVMPSKDLFQDLKTAIRHGRKVHFLPPLRPENAIKLQRLTGVLPAFLREKASVELVRAIVDLRSVKEAREVGQIEAALETTRDMQIHAMQAARPGMRERDLLSGMQAIVVGRGLSFSFAPIVTVHAEVLHNRCYNNRMLAGQLLLNDSGADSPMHYASDITRTFPVGGRFTSIQKEMYAVVLAAQETAIRAVKPGAVFREIHLEASRALACGLVDIGLMRGDVEEIVSRGAHALFFPCGLGHMMGLDTHDMEDLGEDHVGYTKDIARDKLFGLRFLRLAKKLETGHVLTVEPGIYFIPELIDRWKSENRHNGTIDYDAVDKYRNFGGIRIEDDIVVETDGGRILGPPIPKTIPEIEAIMCADGT